MFKVGSIIRANKPANHRVFLVVSEEEAAKEITTRGPSSYFYIKDLGVGDKYRNYEMWFYTAGDNWFYVDHEATLRYKLETEIENNV